MSGKPVRLTQHAEENLRKRALPLAWVLQAVESPDRIEADPEGTGYSSRYISPAEADGRVLRVLCFESAEDIRVLTAFLDRGERRRRP